MRRKINKERRDKMLRVAFKISETEGVAFNRKAGSSSISKAICEQLGYGKDYTFHFPDDGKEANRTGWQSIVEKIENPETLYLLVRNPEDRFLSALAQLGRDDIDVALDELESGNCNIHFDHQVKLIGGGKTKLYRFPSDLPDFYEDIRVKAPTRVINERKNKAILTAGQKARVSLLYEKDFELFNSITKAGKLYVPPAKESEPEGDKAPSATFAQLREALVELGNPEEQALISINNPLVLSLARLFGFDSESLKSLFEKASKNLTYENTLHHPRNPRHPDSRGV